MKKMANAANKNLYDLFTSSSIDIIRAESKTPEFSLKKSNVPEAHLKFIQELSCIMLISEEMKIIFKIHYWLSDAIQILNKVQLNRRDPLVQEYKAKDLFKEISNVIAGRIKYRLCSGGLKIVHSLPLSLDGYNQIFFPKQKLREYWCTWLLKHEKIEIVCSATTIFLSQQAIKNMCDFKLKTSKPTEVEIF